MYLCRSIAETSPEKAAEAIQGAEMIELRADLMGLAPSDIGPLVGLAERAIVTCHTSECRAIYEKAIECGVWAIDIALLSPSEILLPLIKAAHNRGVRVILSHHFEDAPSLDELTQRAEEANHLGTDIIKIISSATSTAEALVPLELYKSFPSERLVAFAMGKAGAFSRRLSLLMGAPYSYVATSHDKATAEGQFTEEELRKTLSGESLENLSLPDRVTPLSSKSEAQRAILAATLTKGKSTIKGMPKCGDTLAAIALARTLGATISESRGTLTIEGVGAKELERRLGHDITSLSVGESALLARLTIPIVATLLRSGEVEIDGCGTLVGRSLRESIELVERYGAECKSNSGHLPLRLSAGFALPEEVELEGGDSSQTISGLMMAAPLIDRDEMTRIKVRKAVSRPYLQLTADIMEQFGAVVTLGGEEPLEIDIEPEPYEPSEIRLQTDWSSAGYFAAAYAIAQSGYHIAERYTLNAQMGTWQGDEVVLMILSTSGAQIEVGKRIEFLPSGRLSAFAYNATHTPDLIPTLAVVALFAEGESVIGGLGRLLNKESNRLEALVENLVAIGADVRIENNRLHITGGRKLHAAPIRTHDDHRIAMAFAVAALFMDERPTLDNTDCVAKSFPTFLKLLNNTK